MDGLTESVREIDVAQAALIYLFFRPHGAITAAIAAVTVTALTTVHFLDPSANWYCLFLFMVLVAVFASAGPETRGRIEAIGFLLLAALIGGITLARRDASPAEETAREEADA